MAYIVMAHTEDGDVLLVMAYIVMAHTEDGDALSGGLYSYGV